LNNSTAKPQPQTRQQIRRSSGLFSSARRLTAAATRIPFQRWLAFALIALEAFTVGYLSKTIVYPAMIVVIAMYGTVSNLRFNMDRQRTYDIIALMAMIFVIKYMATPDDPRYDELIPSQSIGFTLAQYVLAMQSVQFFLKRRDDRLPFSFPGIGVIALVCATMVSRESGHRSDVQAMCIGFAILSALYCDASRRFIKVVPAARRRGRPIATVLVLIAVGSLGWFMASSMHKYERHIERLVNQFLQKTNESTSIGFSESATLGSVSLQKDRNSQQTALRVVSSVEPGYFRARAYDTYENRKWLFNIDGSATYPQGSVPSAARSDTHTGQGFQIARNTKPGTQKFEVWPDVDLGDTFAGPLRTSWLFADARIVTVDTYGVMRSSEARSGVPYTLLVSDARPRSDKKVKEASTGSAPQVNAKLSLERLATSPDWARQNKQLVDLADSLFKNCETVAEKLAATRRYFKENYTYSLKVTPPTKPSREPLEWFLLEQPPAHCEYFASGTAILLRMAGVPCRYIIGFVVSEQNQYSGEWVARNEDAHAWVEAYDETVGWVTVDSTPASGVPDNSSGPSSTQLYEYLRGEFHRIRTGWQQRGFAPIRATLKAIIRSPIGLALISIVTLFATGIMLRLWQRHRYVDRAAYTASTPIVEQLQTARQKIDVTLKRVWRARLPGETVDRYAQQLANAATDQHDPLTKAADWYTQYAKLRFAPGPDHRSVIDIAARASQLTTVLRKRVRQPDEHQNNV